ncbi:MAG: hypothetical protein QM755_08510 [Luteolibacter sp.]
MESRFPSDHSNLARQTRDSHFTLFGIGTLLMPPALLGLLGLGMFFSGRAAPSDSWLLLSAGVTSICGIAAWVSLGLLLYRRSDPQRHLICWKVTAAFGLCAMPSSLLWFLEGSAFNDWWITFVLLVTFVSGIGALASALRNLRLARRSLQE